MTQAVGQLSETERAALAQELLEDMRKKSETLKQLGYFEPPAKEDLTKPAPDNGPRSSAHKYLPVTLLRTLKVQMLGPDHKPVEGSDRIINEEQFDSAKYVRVDTPRPSAYTPPPTAPLRPAVSVTPEQELLTMTVAELHKLPEMANVTQKARTSTNKTEVVQAILAVRARASGAVPSVPTGPTVAMSSAGE